MGIKSFQERITLVSCDIVEEEVRRTLNGKIAFLRPFFLDPALHIFPEMLAEELENALDRFSDSFNSFIIVYGNCHPNIDDLLASYTAKRVKASICVEMMLGKEDYRNELRNVPRTFFLTHGWYKIWRDIFRDQLSVNKKLEKVFFKNYKSALFIDVGIATEKYRSEAKDFSEYFSLQFEEKNTDLIYLRGLLEDALVEIVNMLH
ncbi:MAG: DUF1638 domain-containing protein [Promethearchaeota archaeon]